MRLDVEGLSIETIDQLELDVVYGGLHATTTTGTAGQPVSLPFSLPLTVDLPGSPLIEIDLIAAGKLGGAVLGGDATSVTVQQGYHATGSILLFPLRACTEGALYCGGIPGLSADFLSLYRCTGGVPIFYARCSQGCTQHTGEPAECSGLGLCTDGGTYCGGHVLDGDPNTLYVCKDFKGITPMPCPRGCLVRGDGDDACG